MEKCYWALAEIERLLEDEEEVAHVVVEKGPQLVANLREMLLRVSVKSAFRDAYDQCMKYPS